MADKETGFVIPVSAYADKDSAKAAISELTKGVLSSLKDGYIEVPAEIKASYARGSKELDKAQKDVIKTYEKMSKEGFSSSVEDLDNLIEKYRKFKSLAGKEGKGNSKQTKWLTKTIGETLQPYLAQKRELDKVIASFEESIAKLETSTKTSTKSSSKKPRNFGTHSKEEIDANIKQEQDRKYKGWESTGPKTTSASIDAGRTNPELARLSEYSAHGSKWASELARIMQIEEEKAAQTLVSWIDPHYKVGTRTGEEQNPIGLGNKTPQTTEYQFLSDTIKAVKAQLKKAIKDLESGSEEITLDNLKEYAAVIKVLTKSIGKTTEYAENTITSAIEGIYNSGTEVKTKKGVKSTQTKLGGTNREDGQQKGVGKGHENTQRLVNELYKLMQQWDSEVIADTIAKEMVLGTDKTIKSVSNSKTTQSNNMAGKYVNEVKMSDDYKAELDKLSGATNEVFEEARKGTKATETQLSFDRIDDAREAVSDSKQETSLKLNSDIDRDVAKATKRDVTTGFNTDAKANELIGLVRNILSAITGKKEEKVEPQPELPNEQKTTKNETTNAKEQERPDYSFEMKAVYDEIAEVLKPIEKSLALVPVSNSYTKTTETPFGITKSEFYKALPKLLETDDQGRVEKSKIYASQFNQGVFKNLETAFERLTGVSKRYEKILSANADAQDDMAAARIQEYGLNNGRNPNDTGDKAGMRRILELYRTNKSSIDQNPELIQNIQLTKGRDVDTTELLKELNKALSGKQMENAQNGGGFWKNALGFATGGLGYAFMPSLEKSRAQADGLNQMLGNISNSLQSVLINIQTKETELAGLEKKGDIKFDAEGNVLKGTSAAKKTLADLEEEKLVLDSIKADLLANDEIIKKTGGRFSQMVKYLNFTSPVLKDNNGILRNINSGLDKNGKALKFQTRMAEILNYTYQLMSRHIGQMLKNWLVQLNPITQIKKAFQQFMGWNTKWQRTMNVITYNLHAILEPFMDKIAQFLVNCIGFLDIISMKVQEAFGHIPVSLFDQAAAESQKIREELEAAANVTASFDELHDIGSDNSGANDLMGDIYKPQLSQEWIDLAERIGNLFAGVIKGDLGFGEVMKEILGIAWQGIKTLWSEILWPFIQNTIWPAIKDNWLEILGWMLVAFLAWKGLNLLGDLLFNALFGKLSLNSITGVFSKVGSWITTLLGASGFGQGIMMAFQSLFAGGKYSLIGTLGEMFTNSAAITQAGSWGSMIGFALVKGLVGVLSIALGGKMVTDAFDSAADKTSYNIGLEQSGGKDEDKKGTGWDIAKGAAGGAAIGFGIGQIIPVIGPAVGAAVGAVVGALTTALAPAFEQVEVAARNANNEMQKIEYYEGQVQGYSTQVTNLTELQKVLNDTLRLQTEKVYEEGEQLGITKTRMDELVGAVQNGTFHTGMLSGAEVGLTDSLTALNDQQIKNTEATKQLEEAKKKLQKAEIELAIAEDVAAGNFELASARISYAEAAMLYTEQEATDKRIQLYKQAGEEEAKHLLQDLTPQQRTKMAEINNLTEGELASLVEKWRDSSDETKKAFLSGVDQDTQNQFAGQMNAIDNIIEEHQGFWQGVGDTLKEIFTFGIADTWTYNGEKKASAEYKSRTIPAMAVGTNYVPNDGLAYLHQGEAVVPKKYNNPYQQPGLSAEEREYMSQMIKTMESLDSTMKQGINVNGQFVQRGSDLVATVEKANNRMSNNILNNRVYAR